MNTNILILSVAACVTSCRAAEQPQTPAQPLASAQTIAATVEAPWDHRYMSKPRAVNLCDLVKASSAIVIGTVTKTAPFDDPGGYFSNYSMGAKGEVTLVDVELEKTLVGTLETKAFTVEVSGRLKPVPGEAAPSSMVPNVAVGEKAVFFLTQNPKNQNVWIIEFDREGYFPIGSSGKVSNGVTAAHPPKDLPTFLGELQTNVQNIKTCTGNFNVNAKDSDAGPTEPDGAVGAGTETTP